MLLLVFWWAEVRDYNSSAWLAVNAWLASSAPRQVPAHSPVCCISGGNSSQKKPKTWKP